MAAVMKYISNTQSEMNETWEGVALSHCRIVTFYNSLIYAEYVFVTFTNSCICRIC